MKSLVYQIIIVILLVTNNTVYSKQPEVLWNDECPSAVSDNEQERQALKKEFPENHDWFGTLLNWQQGTNIIDPNEELQKELIITEKVCKEVLNSQTIPLENIKTKIELLNIKHEDRTERILQFRVKTNNYIVKCMKRKYTLIVIAKSVSSEVVNVEELAKKLFNNRILPMKWESPFFMEKMKTESKILGRSYWFTRDIMRINNNDKAYTITSLSGLPRPELIPIGEGLYGEVTTYTDNKFAMFIINYGPKILKKDAPGYPGSAGTGENIED